MCAKHVKNGEKNGLPIHGPREEVNSAPAHSVARPVDRMCSAEHTRVPKDFRLAVHPGRYFLGANPRSSQTWNCSDDPLGIVSCGLPLVWNCDAPAKTARACSRRYRRIETVISFTLQHKSRIFREGSMAMTVKTMGHVSPSTVPCCGDMGEVNCADL